MKYELMYRDASNYKFVITAQINKELKVGDEITMEELGYTQEQFFDEYIHYLVDPEVDHNILEVMDILPEIAEVDVIV